MNRLFLMILMVMLTVSCGANQSKEDKNFVIKTDKARLVVGNNVKKFSFISKPQHTTNLSFRVGGQVKNFDTYVGNYFKKGDVIAEIDDRDFIIRKESNKLNINSLLIALFFVRVKELSFLTHYISICCKLSKSQRDK